MTRNPDVTRTGTTNALAPCLLPLLFDAARFTRRGDFGLKVQKRCLYVAVADLVTVVLTVGWGLPFRP